MEVKEVVRNLLASGAKKVADIKVTNVTVKALDTYVRVALTLDRKVEGYVLNEADGTYAIGEVKVIFVSLYLSHFRVGCNFYECKQCKSR